MAETVQISTRENFFRVVVDGNEIRDVLSYTLREDREGPRLTLEIAVMGPVKARA